MTAVPLLNGRFDPLRLDETVELVTTPISSS